MGLRVDEKEVSVTQDYSKYGWFEAGDTPVEEKIVDYSILCIRYQDPNKGYSEFKEIPDNTKFLKRLVDQVYNKDPQNVSNILAVVDFVDDLGQKFFIIWALFDQIVLNDDSIGAKNTLNKLKKIMLLINNDGKFSEHDLWQMKMMEHQLNNLQHMAPRTADLVSCTNNSNSLSSFEKKLSILEHSVTDLASRIDNSFKSFEQQFSLAMGHRFDEFQEVVERQLPEKPIAYLYGKKFRIFSYCNKNDSLYGLKCQIKGNVFDPPNNDEILWVHKIKDSEKKNCDLWIIERFPNPLDETYYLKNVACNRYLRTINKQFDHNKKNGKVTLAADKLNIKEFEWKLRQTGGMFYLFSNEIKGIRLYSFLCGNTEEKGFVCCSKNDDNWIIEIEH